MNPRTEWCEDADAPVADLVGETFDNYGPVVGHRPGGFVLVVEIIDKVLRRALIEAVGAKPGLCGVVVEGA